MHFDYESFRRVPFHFWSAVFFVLGSIWGSFLNVCIYRMPRNESVIHPPSHCPHCEYSIPWFLNIPLVTWIALRGRCRNCRAPISIRYLLVEFLTGLAFLACWLSFGRQSPAVALVYCLVLAGFIVATFIDFEHFIIPDEITLGGVGAGVLCSLLVPALHGETSIAAAMKASFIGAVTGAAIIYAILRAGKLAFGKHKIVLAPGSRIIFTETAVQIPEHGEILYEELFYRKSDKVKIEAKTVELPDICYFNTRVSLGPTELKIGDLVLNPETVPHMEVVTDELSLPREAMGFGDVKFMAAIGAFLGWKAVIFSLMISSMIGAAVGLTLIALKKQEWSSRLPYGPYIALAATIWIFAGPQIVSLLFPMP